MATIALGIIGSTLGSIGAEAKPDGTHAGPLTWVLPVLLGAWWLGTVVPVLALACRRLHDANLRGWLLLIGLLPGLGIVVLITMASPSKPEGARFDRPRP